MVAVRRLEYLAIKNTIRGTAGIPRQLAYPWEMKNLLGRQLWLENLSPPTQHCVGFAEYVRTHHSDDTPIHSFPFSLFPFSFSLG